ncbi:MAG: hypothetical protein HY645_04390 [Acidobacteria bacterium]|nr:hypothetical protein [Acidobacteriota bacterium]
MSRHKQFPTEHLKTYPLSTRKSKVGVQSFARPLSGDSLSSFKAGLPDILAGRDIRLLAEKILKARDRGRAIICGFGGHVVKVGLAPVLIQLCDAGLVTALATNGSGMIHDFEIAWCGATSEDVEEELKSGSFGMAHETGELLNRAINKGAQEGKGLGESIGAFLNESTLAHPEFSLLLQAYQRSIPFTVHSAFGTDIIHVHPAACGEALGKGSQTDFRIFVQQVSELNDGGVYLNLGSAVILPEVFLKAVSLVRNSGLPLADFTTANLDFIQHYRPMQNVVRRPVAGCGTGIALTGHHELLVPLLAAFLLEP